MGLDVYLYRVDDVARFHAVREQYNERSEELWEEYTTRKGAGETEEQLRAWIEPEESRLQEELGCDDSGYLRGGHEAVERDSAVHPGQLFKVGYFRSSYNGTGINRVLEDMGLPGLYQLFGVPERSPDYWVRPDWAAARERAAGLVDALRQRVDKREHRLRAEFFGQNRFLGKPPKVDAQDALAAARAAIVKGDSGPFGGGGWSSAEGSFFPKGLEVVAILPSEPRFHFEGPGAFVVYVTSEETARSYLDSAEVILETIDYVLANPVPEPGAYLLAWSA